MSYILDALNKSEQERKRSGTPGIDTVHRGAPRNGARINWMIALVVIIGINVALFSWYFLANTAPISIGVDAPVVAPRGQQAGPLSEPEHVPAIGPERTQAYEGEGLLITPGDFTRTRSTADAYQSGTGAIRISQLPVSVQRELPDLVFSSHIYADDPDLRMVNINGELLREGDRLGRLQLLEISEEGVILAYQQHKFEVSVLRDWTR